MLKRGLTSLAENVYPITNNQTNDEQSIEYGKCISADYNNIYKDKCSKEFLKLQQCYTVSSSKFVKEVLPD